MKPCPFCAEQIQDEAIKCRYCGEFLDGRAGRRGTYRPPFGGGHFGYYGWNYEYRSKAELFGLPLVHIAQGYDSETGAPRVARGIIALGNIAIGVLAVGGVALGGIALGGVALGVFAFAGLAVGGVALGGMSLGLFLAIGGLALSTAYALGGAALAPHAISGLGADPAFVKLLESWWPGIHGSLR